MTMPKFATKEANNLLTRLDKAASAIQANYKSWGMPFEAAKEIVNVIDKTADEIESTAFGEESFEVRQAEVVAKTAHVVNRDSDEPYMDTFNAPMRPIQMDADEPYMKAYADDQSTAVHSGKSTAGRPLAP
jgi:hypothetical protein